MTAPAEDIERLELALVTVVRRAKLPRVHARVTAGGPSLDRALYPVLARVADEGPMRLSELADALGVQRSTVSRQIAELERAGLVERHVDPSDGRASMLLVTKRGAADLARLRARWRTLLGEITSDWPAKDVARLGDLLGRLADGFNAAT